MLGAGIGLCVTTLVAAALQKHCYARKSKLSSEPASQVVEVPQKIQHHSAGIHDEGACGDPIGRLSTRAGPSSGWHAADQALPLATPLPHPSTLCASCHGGSIKLNRRRTLEEEGLKGRKRSAFADGGRVSRDAPGRQLSGGRMLKNTHKQAENEDGGTPRPRSRPSQPAGDGGQALNLCKASLDSAASQPAQYDRSKVATAHTAVRV